MHLVGFYYKNHTICGVSETCFLYRVIQKEISEIWDVIMSVIVREKKFVCKFVWFWMVTEIVVFEKWYAMFFHSCSSWLLLAWDEERSWQNEGGYSRRIARSHFGRCCQHIEAWRSTETNNTRSSHTNSEVRWGWRWNLGTFIVNCDKSRLKKSNVMQ